MRTREELNRLIKNFLESRKDELIQLGNWFWKNPEPGYREKKTSARAIEFLRGLGLDVKTGLAITGFRAEINTGKPGPTVALLGELDSLIIPSHPECDPQTGAVHACGHHSSLTALLGTAMVLVKSGVLSDLCGKIVLIGCPAEEGIENEFRMGLIREGKINCIAGKAELICEGVFNDIDLAFMNHQSSNFAYNDHNGSVNKKITFHGKSCHAAHPGKGHNALNAANLALHAIGLLRESYSDSDKIRIHGIITNGGEAVNVIPDTVTMEYMLRAPAIEEIVALNDRFDKIVLHAAKAAECEAESQTVLGYMPLLDDPDLGKILGDAVQTVAPGASFNANTVFSCASTDMGDVSAIMPAIHGYFPGASGTGHGKDYRISDPEKAYIISSELATVELLDLLYGNGEKAKKIAAKKKNFMSVQNYVKTIRSLSRVLRSQDL